MAKAIHDVEREHLKEEVSEFNIGDTVDVHVRIVEGEKERVQIFNGTVIARRGSGARVPKARRQRGSGSGTAP